MTFIHKTAATSVSPLSCEYGFLPSLSASHKQRQWGSQRKAEIAPAAFLHAHGNSVYLFTYVNIDLLLMLIIIIDVLLQLFFIYDIYSS